ncbi:MAG TPA: 23S rRNA (adenine(2503)-C(2))-methyltransferase RlmN [Planctomycetota bacterium]|nr:23S rRNA (adenine(2503)-C(2))-methyltransferase RlmN [Planctomycetota bacterium]
MTALAPAELEARLAALGLPKYRARQVRDAVLRRGARSFEEATDLPRELRERLSRELRARSSAVERVQRSRDGTAKLLVLMEDGRRVETVVIPEGRRTTVCVSTEVGCPVRCAFCASGLEGLVRPLAAHEIAEQFLHARSLCADDGVPAPTNVVLMGMGEPLLNFDATAAALRMLRDRAGIALGARRITLSTVGILDGIERLKSEGHKINLAVSLHAPDDRTRDRIVPLNTRSGVARIVEAARRYARETGRDVTFEYVLLAGVNDSDAQAEALAGHAAGAHINVNLIPFNRVPGLPFRSPTPARVEAFSAILRRRGVPVHVRRRRGDDIAAACGQLRLETEKAERAREEE